ncbi:DUF2203 family protein [soil metagenome]
MSRFYGIDEANELLVELRPLLEKLRSDRQAVADSQRQLVRARTTNGSGDHAQELALKEAEIRQAVGRMRDAVVRLEELSVTLRDIAAGLVDFPALAAGRPIWLCWRLGETAVEWWHETDDGFDNRKPLLELR